MKFWNSYPFFRLIIPFGIGILSAIYLPVPHFIQPLWLIIITLLLLFLTIFTHYIKTYSLRWLPGLFLNVFVLSTGYTLTLVQTDLYRSNHFSHVTDGSELMVVRISEQPSERARSVRAFGKVVMLKDSINEFPTIGKILIYLEKDSVSQTLKYGDIIVAKAIYNHVPSPSNPHQFDYQRYLSHSGIYHQTWLGSNDWQRIKKGQVNPIFSLSYKARDIMLRTLEEQGLDGNEFAVVAAILLGYDDRMEPELRNHYAGAGALHVLCVSGLHVGIIFMIVSVLLKKLTSKSGRIIKFFILLGSIWMYAFITGLAPSVLRASVMFSLFTWRELIGKKSNSYNILAASAFILLAYDPYLITKVGFQLSYSAVIGIISLYDLVYRQLIFKNAVLDYFWKLAAISIVAQIGTSPLAIFYFNQFPLYFLLANIVVIPVVWLIVYSGIATLIVAIVSLQLSAWIAKVLYYEVYFLNMAVEWVNKLPQARVEGLVLNFAQVIIIYLVIIFLVRFLVAKEGKYGVITLLLLLIFTASITFQKMKVIEQNKIIVYNVKGYSAIDLVMGQDLISIADSSLLLDQKTVDFNIKNARIYSGIHKQKQLIFEEVMSVEDTQIDGNLKVYANGVIQAFDKVIAILNDKFQPFFSDKPLQVDWVILQKNCPIPLDQIGKMFTFERVIFDSSNTPWRARQWHRYCTDNQVPFFDVSQSGALVVTL